MKPLTIAQEQDAWARQQEESVDQAEARRLQSVRDRKATFRMKQANAERRNASKRAKHAARIAARGEAS